MFFDHHHHFIHDKRERKLAPVVVGVQGCCSRNTFKTNRERGLKQRLNQEKEDDGLSGTSFFDCLPPLNLSFNDVCEEKEKGIVCWFESMFVITQDFSSSQDFPACLAGAFSCRSHSPALSFLP